MYVKLILTILICFGDHLYLYDSLCLLDGCHRSIITVFIGWVLGVLSSAVTNYLSGSIAIRVLPELTEIISPDFGGKVMSMVRNFNQSLLMIAGLTIFMRSIIFFHKQRQKYFND